MGNSEPVLVLGTGTVVICIVRSSLHVEQRRMLFACYAYNAYVCFLGIDGWMAELTDGWILY